MKPTSNFKLNRQTKRFMATIVDPQKRNEFKRGMIEAQLESERIIVSKKNKQ
jgi:hypothetical protein